VWLSKRNLDPNTPVKFALGLIFMGLGFVVMMWASYSVVSDGIVGPEAGAIWLIVTYLLHTFGEICLYPTGLSAVTKLSPTSLKGQLMGIWFMSLALGNLVAGQFAGNFEDEAILAQPTILPDLFFTVVKVILTSGLVILVLNKPIRKLMGNIR
jgi:POT family proton-dependent oligopeptide transporter